MILGLFSVVFVPLIVGYIYGMNHIDPNTYKGRYYYNSSEGGQ